MIEKELKARLGESIKKVIKNLISFQYPESNFPTFDKVPLYIRNKSDQLISMYTQEDCDYYTEKRVLYEYKKALKTRDGKYFLEFFDEEVSRNAILSSEVGADVSDILSTLKNEESIRSLKENIIKLDRFDLIKQIHKEGSIELSTQEASIAVKNERKEILNYFFKQAIVEPTENLLMYMAVTCENKEMQEFLVDFGANTQVIGISSEDNRLDYIKKYKNTKDLSDNLNISLEEKAVTKKIKI